jgi:O-antigen ligase
MWDRVLYHVHLDGTDLISRLIDSGGMQDGQRMAVSLIAAVMTLVLTRGKMRGWGLVAILFALAGVLLSFKRGPWVTLSILAIMGLGIAAWRYPLRRTLFIAVMAGALLWGGAKLMPEGSAKARADFQTSIHQSIPKGGRVCMWFQVTPELVKAYPWGIGYKALDGQMMRQISRRIPAHQAHVHSNPLQAAVDGGWVGLILFLTWSVYVFRDLRRYIRQTSPQSEERRLAWAVSGMFLTLFLIGFVEYQLGSGQITMMYGVLMGAAAIAARETRAQRG